MRHLHPFDGPGSHANAEMRPHTSLGRNHDNVPTELFRKTLADDQAQTGAAELSSGRSIGLRKRAKQLRAFLFTHTQNLTKHVMIT